MFTETFKWKQGSPGKILIQKVLKRQVSGNELVFQTRFLQLTMFPLEFLTPHNFQLKITALLECVIRIYEHEFTNKKRASACKFR